MLNTKLPILRRTCHLLNRTKPSQAKPSQAKPSPDAMLCPSFRCVIRCGLQSFARSLNRPFPRLSPGIQGADA